MSKVSLILCLHSHQPVGNFDFVIDDAYRRAYRPLVETLAREGVPAVLHCSGWLLEQLLERYPGYGDDLRKLIEAGQVELLTGGFYEPILPSIPDADKVHQIRTLTRFLEARLGARPSGIWLTERVWEPGLVGPLAAAGVRYFVTDDTHFKYAGCTGPELAGYRLTEDAGTILAVFPGSKRLRYLIPFHDPEETIAHLATFRDLPGSPMVCMADDTEKFGVWPGTHETVYGKGWFTRFFRLVHENSDWLEMTTFSAFLDKVPPIGRIYLPTASYEEMTEWSLPTPEQERYEDALRRLESDPSWEPYRVFFKGGFWRGFLTKYEESNWLHKRMLRARRVVADAYPSPEGEGVLAWQKLWASQCNDALWHGVFGGIYAPNLRFAAYRNLLEAERLARRPWTPPAVIAREDLDCDGCMELTVEAGDLRAFVCPEFGATIRELDWLPGDVNLVNSMRRRREAYHRKLRDAVSPGEARDGTIHDRMVAKEPGLADLLTEDPRARELFVDHLWQPGAGSDDASCNRAAEILALGRMAYSTEERVDGERAELAFQLVAGHAQGRLHLKKVIEIGPESRLTARYTLASEAGRLAARFGVELTMNLLAPDAPDRYVEWDGGRGPLGRRQVLTGIEALAVVDLWLNVRVRVEVEPQPVEIWWLPIESVSLSESGFERVYQGSALIPIWDLDLAEAAAHEAVIRLTVERAAGA